MKKLISYGPVLVALVYAPAVRAQAEPNNTVTMVMFSGQACPSCEQMSKFLDELKKTTYPSLVVEKYDLFQDDKHVEMFQAMGKTYGVSAQHIPTIFLGDKVIVGYGERQTTDLKNQLALCFKEGCVSPHDKKPCVTPQEAAAQLVALQPGEEPAPECPTGQETITEEDDVARMVYAWILFVALLLVFIALTGRYYHRRRRRKQ